MTKNLLKSLKQINKLAIHSNPNNKLSKILPKLNNNLKTLHLLNLKSNHKLKTLHHKMPITNKIKIRKQVNLQNLFLIYLEEIDK